MCRLAAFLPFLVLAVAACERQTPTSPQAEAWLAVYPDADFVLQGMDYSDINPPDISGAECEWIEEGDAIYTYWSQPDCQALHNISPWVEYEAWLTRGVWRIGLNAINTGYYGLGDDPTWYPEFQVGNSLTGDIITIPASDTEINHGYTEYKVLSEGLYTVRYWWLNDKFDDAMMLDANIKIMSVFFDKVPGAVFQGLVRRPYHWSVHDLPWPGGIEGRQLQSVYPLDAKGDLVLVGGQGHEHDYVVFDLSSGSPVVVASSGNLGGYKTAAYSPPGSSVGFGGGGDVLVKYDGGFQLISLPCAGDDYCSMNGVWASSPTDVWITRSRRHTTGDDGDIYFSEIWYWNGHGFALEYEAQAGSSQYIHIWDIWGHGSEPLFAVGDRILRRDADGGWQEFLGPAELPTGCDYLFDVSGMHPSDVWVGSFGDDCILHYDGSGWSKVTKPIGYVWTHQMWPLDANQILMVGQGNTHVTADRIAMWGSVDGGQAWRQLQNPVFTQLPPGAYSGFFHMAGTVGSTRVYAPTVRGGRLVMGSLIPFQSHVNAFAVSEMAQSVDSEEFVLPEPEK